MSIVTRFFSVAKNLKFSRLFAALSRRFYSCEYYLWLEGELKNSPTSECDFGENIRWATADDIPLLLESWPTEFKSADKDELKILLQDRFHKRIPCIVAISQGKVIGAVWANSWLWAPSNVSVKSQQVNACEFINWFVSSSARGSGVGRALVLRFSRLLFTEGYSTVYSRHLLPRFRAAKVMESCGLAPAGVIACGYRFGKRYSFVTNDHTPAEMPHCLIIAGKAYGSSLALARSLSDKGVRCHLAVTHGSTLPYRFSRSVASTVDLRGASRSDLGGAILEWVRFLKINPRTPLFPMTDIACEAICELREYFDKYCVSVLPSTELVTLFADKARANSFIANNGWRVPSSVEVDSDGGMSETVESLRFPVIVKPLHQFNSNSPFKARIVTAKSDLPNLFAETSQCKEKMLVQEYIEGDDSSVYVYLFYRSQDGEILYSWTGRKLRQSPPSAGIMALGIVEDNDVLKNLGDAIVERADYRGVGGIEFKKRAGEYWFVELSSRLEGFHHLGACAGMDLPWLAYQNIAMGTTPPAPRLEAASYINMQSYLKVVQARGGVKLLVRDIFIFLRGKNKVWAVWSATDPYPFVATLIIGFKRLLGKN